MQMWEQFLSLLEQDLGKDVVGKWLRSLQLLRFDAANLYLEAEDSFQANWFEEHIRPKASQHLKTSSGKPFKIHLHIKKKVPFPKSSPEPPTSPFRLDPLPQEFCLEHFILTEPNTLAFRILAELASFDIATWSFTKLQSPPTQYNPILLYGPPGTGKTHLLCALALAMQKQKREVLYVKAETFTEHMIKAIRQSQMAAFRAAYRKSDVLIVDNIEHFANKSATQEEFFHTFNNYHMSGKQLVLASSLPPSKLQGIESRLVSRFEWGVTLPLAPLPQDKLPLLLLKKLNLYHLALAPEISSYLLSTFQSPLSLTKALETLSYKNHMDRSPLSMTTIKTITQSLADDVQGKSVSVDKILQILSEFFRIERKDILGKTQTKEIVFPRQLAMYLLRYKLRMPYPQIGKIFSKDHSTVMSSVKVIEKELEEKKPSLIRALDTIEKKLTQ